MQRLKVLSISVDIISALVGVIFACLALVLVAAIYAPHLWLLRSAGIFLSVVVVAHVLPLTLLRTRWQIIVFTIGAVAAAACFSYVDFLAERDDSDIPYDVASFARWCLQRGVLLCVFPCIRGIIRWFRLTGVSTPHWPNQPLQPTAGRSDV